MGTSEGQGQSSRGVVNVQTDRDAIRGRILVACCLALVLSAAPATAQICGGTYLMQGDPTSLIELDTSANPFVPVTLGTAPFLYNAMAFRPLDGNLYAMQGGTNTLIQINIDGSVTTVGTIAGLPDPSPSNYHVGAFADDDRMYVRRGNNTTTLYRIDIDALTATAVPLSAPLAVADLAWFNGLFWGVNSGNNLVSVTSGGEVTTIGPTGAPTAAFGAMISAQNGIFGVNNNGDGFFQFDPTTGEATLISDAPGSANNDGARCLSALLEFDVNLSVTKDDGSLTYLPGTDVVYTVVVANAGPFGVQNAVVSDPLPAGITTASWTCTAANGAACDASGGTGAIADTPDLPVGSSVTYQLTLAVPLDFTGDLENTATVGAPLGFVDPDTSDNTATDIDASAARPGIALDKTGDGPEPLSAGAQISYSFLVTNIGNLPLTGVTVTDPLPGLSPIACPGTTLAPSASMTCSAIYTITQQDADNGILQNTATASGQPPGTLPPVTTQDSVVLPPSQAPGISLAKAADGTAPLTIGSVITYSFVVTNTGNLTLTNVTITDPLVGLSPITCPGTTLAPSEVMTCTATYTVTPADVDAGIVQNAATVTGTPPPGIAPPTSTSTTSFPPVLPVPAMPRAMLLLLVAVMTLGGLWMLRRPVRRP